MPVERFGGSFAQPLSDELLAEYEQLAEEAPTLIRDVMRALLVPVKLWWSLPESTGDGIPHASGRGVIVKLDNAIQKALWESIPWEHEIKAMASVVDQIQAEQDAENSRRLQQWKDAIALAIKPQYITGLDLTTPQAKVLKRVHKTILRAAADGLVVSPDVHDKVIEVFLPGSTPESIREGAAQVQAWLVAVQQIYSGAQPSPLPRPQLLDVRLRRAAHHLLWFVTDLNADREPITTDKL